MSQPTLFVSDLHLPAGPSALRDAFIGFLQGPARSAASLYILGDLFEYWIGDDVGLQLYAPEIDRLAALTQSGVPVCFMHGNRDFMVGADFAQRSGVTLLQDPLVRPLHGRQTLLSHGDLYCTDDVPYQRWRRVSRTSVVQRMFLLMPVAWRDRFAGGLRGRRRDGTMSRPKPIVDVNDAAIRDAFAQLQVSRMIHGHTHRPATHRYEVHGVSVERIVLADWRPQHLEYLRMDDQGVQRVTLPG